MPVAPDGKLTVPQISLEEGNYERRVVHLYRRPEVDFSLSEDPVQTSVSEWCAGVADGRYVASIADGDKQQSRLLVHENSPQVSAQVTTELTHTESEWLVGVDLSVQVEGGVVDTLRLRIPDTWTLPIDVTPAVPIQLGDASASGDRVLTIRPPQAIASTFQVSLEVPLVTDGEQEVRAPDVELLDIADVDRFVVLPRRIADQDLAWTPLRGLDLESRLDGDKDRYRVVGVPMQATLRNTVRVLGTSRIHLADYFLSCHDDLTFRGVVGFDIEPAGSNFCTLRMPEGTRLLQVTVGGLPAVATALSEGEWQVRLVSDYLPQRLTALFSGSLAPCWVFPGGLSDRWTQVGGHSR